MWPKFILKTLENIYKEMLQLEFKSYSLQQYYNNSQLLTLVLVSGYLKNCLQICNYILAMKGVVEKPKLLHKQTHILSVAFQRLKKANTAVSLKQYSARLQNFQSRP